MSRETQTLLEAFEHYLRKRTGRSPKKFCADRCRSIPARWRTKTSARRRLLYQDRALITIVPHTTSYARFPVRGFRTRLLSQTRSLSGPGCHNVPDRQALHRLGTLQSEAFDKVLNGLLRWLGVSVPQ